MLISKDPPIRFEKLLIVRQCKSNKTIDQYSDLFQVNIDLMLTWYYVNNTNITLILSQNHFCYANINLTSTQHEDYMNTLILRT